MIASSALSAQNVGYIDVKVGGKTEKLRIAELSHMYCKNGVTIFVKSQAFENGKEYSYTKPELSYSPGKEGLGVGNETVTVAVWKAWHANGVITIQNDSPIGRVSIYSLMGTLIAEFDIKADEATLYVDLPQGVYMLKNGSNTLKFVSK
jgi:hypothetical protein